MGLVSKHQQILLQQIQTPLWNGYSNMLKTLTSVFLSPKHWILEFLQNAEDAEAPEFAIYLESNCIRIYNNGKPFTETDFDSICDVNSRKSPSMGLRGYLGIGFKSIFRVTDQVNISSGDFHFSFSKIDWEKYTRENKISLARLTLAN